MFLRSIQLRDWKAYASGTFDFPVPTKNRNVVLIGAKNGYGKTSLLEALILGLYGRDGMNALARAITSNAVERLKMGATALSTSWLRLLHPQFCRILSHRSIRAGSAGCH